MEITIKPLAVESHASAEELEAVTKAEPWPICHQVRSADYLLVNFWHAGGRYIAAAYPYGEVVVARWDPDRVKGDPYDRWCELIEERREDGEPYLRREVLPNFPSYVIESLL